LFFQYKLDECGGEINGSSFIKSPSIEPSEGYVFRGPLYCTWNITAPADRKIVIKFEDFSMEHSDYCSFDYVELFNGSLIEDKVRLAKICGNLTNTIKPIVIDNNHAVLRLKTDQTNTFIGFSAAIMFKQKCDKRIELNGNRPTFVLDRTNRNYNESMECIFKVTAEPMSSIKMDFNSIHLSICDPDQNTSKHDCDCDFVEVLDGNGPFSNVIAKTCGHEIPPSIISTRSSLYVRFVTSGVRPSTGFMATFTMLRSICGNEPYANFTGNETEPSFVASQTSLTSSNYQPNVRCMWIAEAPYGQIFEIQFHKFELQDSENCANDSLTIEDNSVKESITEGLGEEIIFRGKSQAAVAPSFYTGISGPTAPHIYCGSGIPHDYISQTNKINILFQTDSMNEFPGFNFSIRTVQSCSRNFTSLQGRIVSSDKPENCKTTIKVPENYTISLYFHRFFFYDSDCSKSFLKVYDGSFDNGILMNTFCGYASPDPIFSSTNQLSLVFHFNENAASYAKGNYDIMYLATDRGQGCGGEIYNYGGIFTSPLYPSNSATNRTTYDCTWTVTVPQNLKVALRFASKKISSG
jgi:cubilin